MAETFIKPSGGIVQDALKVMKTDFGGARSAEYIPNLIRAAAFPNNAATEAWRGDIYHQIAEWYVRRGMLDESDKYFELSLESFNPSETLGPARAYRGFSMRHMAAGKLDLTIELLQSARALHARDRKNKKGQRQLLITQASVLETRVLADDDKSSAIDELVELALFDSTDFCLRDQHDRVSFVLPHTRGADKRALHVRQVEINAKRRKPVRTATSIAQVVIDNELHLAGKMLGAVLSKGVVLPRPE
ncbi:MAG: hypothetical protein V4678_02205 [Patescibacteria group bacterium]